MQRRPASARIARHRLGAWRGALAAAGVLAAGWILAQDEFSWRDIEGRIQYGYYTEDARSLQGLEDTVAAADAHDKLRGYYGALLAWRLALLASRSAAAVPGSSAPQLAQRCVREVDAALSVQADFAEALALRSACLATPFEAQDHAPFAGRRARRDLDQALQLSARNPRVLLIDAMSDYELPASRGGNKERALGKLRNTVAAFEAERTATEHLPAWGAAEAWLLLARDLLDHGEPVAARDALEHALLLAPEFAAGRRLMAKITSG